MKSCVSTGSEEIAISIFNGERKFISVTVRTVIIQCKCTFTVGTGNGAQRISTAVKTGVGISAIQRIGKDAWGVVIIASLHVVAA